MKKIYKKQYSHLNQNSRIKKSLRSAGLLCIFACTAILIYFSTPLLLWQYFFAMFFNSITAPIPNYFILKPETIRAMEKEQSRKINAQYSYSVNWVLAYNFRKNTQPNITAYKISIPQLDIQDAVVSTIDADPAKHLVQYWGTPIPPLQGNTVIFGHSSLPQLFAKKFTYRSIFSGAHTLKENDLIFVQVGTETFSYKIFKIFITTPDDISVLKQDAGGNYITIVTCTPPGTIWKRLIIKARLTNV